MPDLPDPIAALATNDALASSLALGLALVTGVVASRLLWFAVRRYSHHLEALDLDTLPTAGLERALGVLLPIVAIALAIPLSPLEPETRAGLLQVLSPLLALAATWAVVAAIGTMEAGLLRPWHTAGVDNLTARIVTTRIRVARNIATFLATLLGFGVALMMIPTVRQLGTSLLASAGVAGVIIGFAAQRSIATLVAGVQIAFTQPIRIDDVVIVEGEWGRIEEITLTYVVVRIWDLRRLVVPITYFIEKPFQNWTRSSANLLATVTLDVDYTVPVDAVRAELRRVLDATDLYDGEVVVLQVVETTERAVRLRALMDAPDASRAWELRCHVREALVAWLQREHPETLPRIRVEADGPTPEVARRSA